MVTHLDAEAEEDREDDARENNGKGVEAVLECDP
jgi:hypothetical protein